jgi:hypothetical protein
MKIHLQRATALFVGIESIIDCFPIEGTHKAKISLLLLVSCRSGSDPSHVELHIHTFRRYGLRKRISRKFNRPTAIVLRFVCCVLVAAAL